MSVSLDSVGAAVSCVREPLFGLGLQPPLPRGLLGLDALDLIPDRREELLPLGELRLDVLLVRGALSHDLFLLDAAPAPAPPPAS